MIFRWGCGMPGTQEEAVDRIRRDHEHMLGLIGRIKAECSQSEKIDNCHQCPASIRHVCHGNIKQMVRIFVETTLKHNLIESIFMDGKVPSAHRIAHNKAHKEIAEQLKAIRVIFSDDGNCVLAIKGIDTVQQALEAHFKAFDHELERLLLAAS